MRDIGTNISNGRLAATMVVLFLGMFTANLDSTILATAVPQITEEFESLADIGWYGSSAFLTFAAFQTTWGKAFKYYNLKWTYIIAIIIFELGSLVCAIAQNSTTLIVGRSIAGIGGAGLTTGTFVIIGYTVVEELRPAFMGILGATYALASFIGPIVGGAFTQGITWRWCFWMNLPVGGLALILFFVFFRTPSHAKPMEAPWREKILQLDPLGSALILSAVTCYLLALQWGGLTKSWSDSTVIGTLVGFVVLTIACGVNEVWMGERASIIPRLLKKRRILVNQFVVFLNSGGLFILIYYLPIYFQALRNESPLQSGVNNLPFLIGGVFSMVSGVVLSATNQWIPFMAPSAALSAVGAGLIYTFDINTSTGKWVGYQLLAGAGAGFVSQIPIMANTAIVGMADMSSVSAMTLLFQLLGGSFSVSAAQSVFGNILLERIRETLPDISQSRILTTGASDLRGAYTSEELPFILDAYTDAFQGAVAVAIAMMAASFVAALCVKWEPLRLKTSQFEESASVSEKKLPTNSSSGIDRLSITENSNGDKTTTHSNNELADLGEQNRVEAD